jgi:hypothetical protein
LKQPIHGEVAKVERFTAYVDYGSVGCEPYVVVTAADHDAAMKVKDAEIASLRKLNAVHVDAVAGQRQRAERAEAELVELTERQERTRQDWLQEREQRQASEAKRRELVELLTDVKYALEERDCDRIVAKINAALADDTKGGAV